MIFKRPKSAVFNQGGFTLVELMTVMGILGILAAIGLQQLSLQKARALDTKVIALTKNLLTAVAIDEPTGVSVGPAYGGTLATVGLPQVEVPDGMTWYILNVAAPGNNQDDMWMFWFAHAGGKKGYYFWIPGDECNGIEDSIPGDGTGNNSDSIFYDVDTGSGTPYRTAAGI